MKRLLLPFGVIGAGVTLFFLVGVGAGWEEILEPLRTFSVGRASVIVLVTFLFLLAGAIRWRQILQSQGHDIAFIDLIKTYIGGFSLLYFIPIIPFSNELFRASALAEKHNIDINKGLASVVVDRILEMTSNVVVMIGGGIILIALGHSFALSLKIMLLVSFITAWSAMLFFLYWRMFNNKSIMQLFWGRKKRIVGVEEEVFRFFSVDNKFFWQGMALSFIRSAVGWVRIVFVVFFFGKGLVLVPGVAILGFQYLALLVPIPAALGAHDTLQAIAFGTLGLGAGSGAAFALVIRATEAVFALVGLVFAVHFAWTVIRAFVFRKGDDTFARLFEQSPVKATHGNV